MTTPNPNPDPGHGRLGAVIRDRREALGMSMDEVAQRARTSRSTMHRIENGHPTIRPTPSKLANVLRVVGLGADDVRELLPDDEYRSDLLVWLEQGAAVPLVEQLEAMRPAPAPDLVAIHSDGTVVRVSGDAHMDDLADVLKRAGWLVTRPA